jgi:SAM-dependent methyltransferase
MNEPFQVVVNGGYETPLPQPDGFDVVLAIHVIEHVVDPGHFLQVMSMRLKKGGSLLLATPDIGSMIARVLREKWWYIQVPHIYYFNEKTIKALLAKYGFETQKILAYPRIINRDIVRNRIDFLPPWLRPLVRLVLFPFLFFPWTLHFSTGDQLTIWAVKK